MIIYKSQLRFIGINIMALLDQRDPTPDSILQYEIQSLWLKNLFHLN